MEETKANVLWAEFAALAAGYDLSAASLDLPRFEVPQLPATQTAFLLDDRDKWSELRLDRSRGLSASGVAATLVLKLNEPLLGTRPPDNTYQLVATDVAVDSTGRQVVLGFPSLAKLGV